MEVKKAEVKARLLTGTYMLKETKAKFSRNTDTPLYELSIWFLFVRVTMPFSMSIEESRMSCISCLFSHIAS
jgi:hypothetical protein